MTHHNLPDASDLMALIGSDTLVLVGQSGVGKSSLIKRLLPEASIRVGELSEIADKGRHTTTTAELFHLPGGGRLIDSPGVRDFGLTHVSQEAVANGFREFRPFWVIAASVTAVTSEPGCWLARSKTATSAPSASTVSSRLPTASKRVTNFTVTPDVPAQSAP